MKLFSKDKKATASLLSPSDGEVIPLSDVPDEAFSSGMLGEGFAVMPENGTVFSPADGVIESISDSRHAYAISSEIGDILVHIGIDSVKVPEAFEPIVKVGERVAAGQPIARVDLGLLRSSGISTAIPVLITDKRQAGGTKIKYGNLRGGRDAALFISK
jgi:glucose-specific phosphotransferase system IIA component